jgi:hypothetical protein
LVTVPGVFDVLLKALLSAALASAIVSPSSGLDVAARGTCMREGRRLAGAQPVSVTRLKRAPAKILDARPRFPPLPSTVQGSGNWVGEALLDRRGKIIQVWPIREPRFTAPVPAFSAAIVDAVRQWQFESVFVKARPSPACIVVTVTIDWS